MHGYAKVADYPVIVEAPYGPNKERQTNAECADVQYDVKKAIFSHGCIISQKKDLGKSFLFGDYFAAGWSFSRNDLITDFVPFINGMNPITII